MSEEKNINQKENTINQDNIKDSNHFDYNRELAEWWRSCDQSPRKVERMHKKYK